MTNEDKSPVRDLERPITKGESFSDLTEPTRSPR